MKTLLSKFKAALAKVVSVFSSGEGQKAFDTVVALVPKAMPIVRVVAALSPTMADDQIVALLDQVHLEAWTEAYLKLPVSDRGPALQHAAANVLGTMSPGTSRPILNAAVELAVVAMKSEAPTP